MTIEIGEKASQFLIENLEDENKHNKIENILLEPELIIRKTT